ncbi:winged helix DNA-binding domain-containing protein [Stieleria sp. TO1_6]|uniref:winged helix-turn-helix domain-containing protein n=1 Tax=Stieleria tagensis TaxID=2956795 RepID=UPI00209AB549|nr:crosslink repair DNA glycosylase YcaQ family protein [Stieleria tagensis]MCO8123499.1 winged helix DNA-binding domain-containing protein [Stieleria tagensis]
MAERLSVDQARKLVLHSQRLPPMKQTGSAIDATLAAIEHLGYIQIDTISAVQRAHHHTLWNRNPRYTPEHLDQLVVDKRVFEYWSHAAAYLPMRDFRHSLITKQRIASGDRRHWYVSDQRLINSVLKRITVEGPLMAKDFENTGKKVGEWSSKPAKRALETLFMKGELMIAGRQNFHKVYDLTQRVLPADTDTTTPTPAEHGRFLITRFLETNGLGQPGEIAYLLKNIKPLVSDCLQEMVASGEVRQVSVNGQCYFALPDSLQLINKPLTRNKLKILSPFDNLLIQRKRMQMLFGFDYLIECYVPQAKRRYGYFSLPILWGGNLVARMDCKADRKESVLDILHLAMEPSLNRHDAFFSALQKELVAFTRFNNCRDLRLHRTSPAKWKPTLQKSLRS